MTGYCTLYLCDRQAVLLREQRSRLTLAGIIGRGDDDRIAAAALRSLLARFPNDRLTVVVDSVDEELLVESLPPLGSATSASWSPAASNIAASAGCCRGRRRGG